MTRVDGDLIERFLRRPASCRSFRRWPLDDDGGWLNVNADTAAAAVAAALQAEKLVFLTDTPGILLDRQRSRLADAAASTRPAAAT